MEFHMRTLHVKCMISGIDPETKQRTNGGCLNFAGDRMQLAPIKVANAPAVLHPHLPKDRMCKIVLLLLLGSKSPIDDRLQTDDDIMRIQRHIGSVRKATFHTRITAPPSGEKNILGLFLKLQETCGDNSKLPFS